MTHTFQTMAFRPMARSVLLLAVVTLAVMLSASALQAQERQTLDSIVALVDDDIILKKRTGPGHQGDRG